MPISLEDDALVNAHKLQLEVTINRPLGDDEKLELLRNASIIGQAVPVDPLVFPFEDTLPDNVREMPLNYRTRWRLNSDSAPVDSPVRTFQYADDIRCAIVSVSAQEDYAVGIVSQVEMDVTALGAVPEAFALDIVEQFKAKPSSSELFLYPMQVRWFGLKFGVNTLVTMDTIGSTIDTMMALYSPDGAVMQTDDDGAGNDTASRIVQLLRADIQYYLAVSEYLMIAGPNFAVTSNGSNTGSLRINIS